MQKSFFLQSDIDKTTCFWYNDNIKQNKIFRKRN